MLEHMFDRSANVTVDQSRLIVTMGSSQHLQACLFSGQQVPDRRVACKRC